MLTDTLLDTSSGQCANLAAFTSIIVLLWGCHSGQGVPHLDPLHAWLSLETHGYLLQNELTCLLLVGMCVLLLLLLRRHAILRPGRGILLLWLLVLLGRRGKAVGGRRHAMLL